VLLRQTWSTTSSARNAKNSQDTIFPLCVTSYSDTNVIADPPSRNDLSEGSLPTKSVTNGFVGGADGNFDGAVDVGNSDGTFDGAVDVGGSDGTFDGAGDVGEADGNFDGAGDVGEADGNFDGADDVGGRDEPIGDRVGDSVGSDGATLGEVEGFTLGLRDGDADGGNRHENVTSTSPLTKPMLFSIRIPLTPRASQTTSPWSYKSSGSKINSIFDPHMWCPNEWISAPPNVFVLMRLLSTSNVIFTGMGSVSL